MSIARKNDEGSITPVRSDVSRFSRGTGGISYARARDGARVFFRQAGNEIDIVAKASKANEARVINYLKSLY